MTCPLLSIIVLAKENTSFAFRHMMDCLQKQTVSPLQIMVVDVNTPGDPYSLSLQEDIRSMQDVVLLPVTGVKTITQACNEALKEIVTPYVCFINSNDYWYPSKAEEQLNELEADLSAPACLCNGYRRLSKTDLADSSLIFSQPETNPQHYLTTEQFFLSSQVMYRTELLRVSGGFDPALTARWDQDALIRMSEMGKIRFVTEPLFDNATAYALDVEEDYNALRLLVEKHYDLLIRNRKQHHHANMLLGKKACLCTLWLNAAIHFGTGALKTPLYSLKRAVVGTCKKIGRGFTRTFKTLRIRLSARKLRLSLRKLRNAPPPAPLMPIPDTFTPLPELMLDPTRHNQALCFAGNKTLQSVVIPDHMTIIHYGMFAGCKELERIVIPSTIMRIEPYAFLGCEKLRHVEFKADSQLSHIGRYVFAGCTSLTSLTLSGNINQMGAYAFAGCTALSGIHFYYHEKGQPVEKPTYPSVLDGIAPSLFAGCASLLQVEFPEGSMLSLVGSEAFLGCAALHHVYLNGNVDAIGAYAFANCAALEGFVLPQIDAVRSIGKKAFFHCEALTYFRLPFALKQIASGCFSGCQSLKYIKIPKKVLYIESHAFSNCRDLNNVILLSGNTKYAPNAFDAHTQIENG